MGYKMDITLVKRFGIGVAIVMLIALCVASSGCLDSKTESSMKKAYI